MGIDPRTLPPQEKEGFWCRQLQEWRTSGLNKQEYCRCQGLPISLFRYWAGRLARGLDKPGAEPVCIVPVPMPEVTPPTSDPAPMRVLIGERYRIEIGADFSVAVLAKLVRALEELL